MFHNRRRLQQHCRREVRGGARPLRAPLLSGCVIAAARRRQTHAPTQKVAVSEQMLAAHLPSLSEPLRLKSVRGFLFGGLFFLLNWAHEMRFPSRPPSLIHRFVAGRGGSPPLVPGCVRAAQNTITKVPERHRQPQL